MPSMVKLLRDLADAYEREEKGEADSDLRKEIAELKEQIAAKPKAEKDEALEEITDEEFELIRQHRAGTTKPPAVVEPPPVAEDPPAKKTRPGRKAGQAYSWTVDDAGKVQRLDIPHVYTGPDEEANVELPDEVTEAVA